MLEIYRVSDLEKHKWGHCVSPSAHNIVTSKEAVILP